MVMSWRLRLRRGIYLALAARAGIPPTDHKNVQTHNA